MRGSLLRALAAAGITLCAARADAQCPDGTPPPCRGATVTAIARRANPALNARTWIVAPFGNVTRSPDLEWVRDASVNLLTLDLGRWTDVNVVSDKQVGDFVRELRAGRSVESLTLGDGLTMARRAGAGMLVMGDVFKLGRGARIVATVFDVRSGARVRTITQQAVDQDSLLTAFTPLARGVLAVPPPPNARAGELGTHSLDAYQSYLLGVHALNRFDLAGARAHLARALAHDSAFALAHFQLSLALSWSEGTVSGNENRVHALAAQRLGASLPPRERALISARLASANLDYARACEILSPLAARDSSDVQVLYEMGECAYHDNTIVPGATDTIPGTLRWGRNTSLRALQRVLEQDPSFHLAFYHILGILRETDLLSCLRTAPDAKCTWWLGAVLRDAKGDSLVVRLLPDTGTNRQGWFLRQRAQSARERPAIANLKKARQIAEDWVAADSTSAAARYGLASVLLSQGDLAGADAQLRRVSTLARAGDYIELRMRMEIAAKLGRAVEARAWFDSLVKAIPDGPTTNIGRGSLELLFGRTSRATTGLTAAAQRIGPEAVAYAREVPMALLGLPRESAGQAEAAYWGAMRDTATCGTRCRVTRLQGTLWFAQRATRPDWSAFAPLVDTLADSRFAFARALSRGDTAALRRAAVTHDSIARGNVDMGWSEYNSAVLAADGYLVLHDSAAALKVARFYVDTALVTSAISNGAVTGMFLPSLWPRMMLLRADLAAAAGSKEEARTWYARVLDLWATADMEVQPTTTRIRAALAALGPATR